MAKQSDLMEQLQQTIEEALRSIGETRNRWAEQWTSIRLGYRNLGQRVARRRQSYPRMWTRARWKINRGGEMSLCMDSLRTKEKNYPQSNMNKLKRRQRRQQPRLRNYVRKNEEEIECPRRNDNSSRMAGLDLHGGFPMKKRQKRRVEHK